MNPKSRRRLVLLITTLFAVVPAFAVLSEKDLSQTLTVLRYELRTAYRQAERRTRRMSGNGARQHTRLVQMMQKSNELSLMLYSQKQDYTFDMTYALNEVSSQYEEFSAKKLPFDEILTHLDIEIDRYGRLIHTLRSLPPTMAMEYVDSTGNVIILPSVHPEQTDTVFADGTFMLDSLSRDARDSCLVYAQGLLDTYTWQRERFVRDSSYYNETAEMLKSAYDYAQARYKQVQRKIFKEGQSNFLTIIKGFPRFWSQAMNDAREKYSLNEVENAESQWRGLMIPAFLLFVVTYLLISIALGVILSRVFTTKVNFFKRKRFVDHRYAMTLILASVIFAISIMIASAVSKQNFISMASKLLVEFAWMLAAIVLSLSIRLEGTALKRGIRLYLPILILCLIIIFFRIVFIPNSLINIIFPPMMLLFTVWQAVENRRNRKSLPAGDAAFGWITLAAMVGTTVISLAGYVLMGVQVLIWWIFQLTMIQTIIAVYDLLAIYYDRHIKERKLQYKRDHPGLLLRTDDDFLAITWPISLLKKALVPIMAVMSIPLSISLSSGVFDLSGVFREAMGYTFLDVEGYIQLSFRKIIMVVCLFFLFSFIGYLAKTLYRNYKVSELLKKSEGEYIRENSFNFTLANNIIGIILWGIYVLTALNLLKIPTAAIKMVVAGLATGLGFAMKDIINNFFYGVQLMSGRLRVGDYIECDGIRGKVESINYQSTQIVSVDGAVMAFPNATLFGKNFKNLTRNNSYELQSFNVGVKYGVDVDEVRRIIVEALQPLCTRDKYGREVVEPKFGIQVRFNDFGDSSVNLSVLQYTTVEDKYAYCAKAKELIYNALKENGIEIPFPQRDLYVKQFTKE